MNLTLPRKQKIKSMEEIKKIAEELKKAAEFLEMVGQKQAETKGIEKRFLTLPQAAEFLSIKPSSLYTLVKKKQIAYYKPNGRLLYFSIDDLNSWQSRNRQASKAEIESELAKNL